MARRYSEDPKEWTRVTSRRNKPSPKPRKLEDLFNEEIQDGARYGDKGQHGAASRISLHSGRFQPLQPCELDPQVTILPPLPPRRQGMSTPDTPETPKGRSRSPRDYSPRRTDPKVQVGPEGTSQPKSPEISDPLANIPDSDQPLTLTNMKALMMSLRSAWQSDMDRLAESLAVVTLHTDSKVDKVVEKLKTVTVAYNELVQSHEELTEEVRWLKSKQADAEDRNRRNNIKIRGVPETVTIGELKHYVADVLKTTLPETSEIERVVDRVHRLPKPDFLGPKVPRDIIMRVHYYHVKEAFLATTRRGQKLPAPYQDLVLYSDLSQTTLKMRKEFATVTNTLRAYKMEYSWGFPTKLRLTRSGIRYVFNSPQEGIDQITAWNMKVIPPPPPKDRRRNLPMDTTPAVDDTTENIPSHDAEKDT